MSTLLALLCPTVLAIVGVTVAQLHGVGFWASLLGSAPTGWAVSLFWEGSSVLFWWRGHNSWVERIAKWTATLALVTGMTAESVKPLLMSAIAASTGDRVLGVLEGQSSAGHWISQTTLKKALTLTGTAPPDWFFETVAWISTLAMPTLYGLTLMLVVMAGREFRRGLIPVAEPPTLHPPEFPPPSAAQQHLRDRPSLEIAEELMARLRRRYGRNKTKLKAIAIETGVSAIKLAQLQAYGKSQNARNRLRRGDLLRIEEQLGEDADA